MAEKETPAATNKGSELSISEAAVSKPVSTAEKGELAVPRDGKSRRRYRSRSLSQSSTDSYSTCK